MQTGRVIVVWILLAVAMIVQGAAREVLVAPMVGALRAHQTSSVAGALIVVLGSALSLRWLGAVQDTPLQLRIGALWLVFTIVFEFVFGHFVVGHSWGALLHDYDLSEGRLWLLVLVATGLGPLVAGRFVGPRPPP